MKYFLLSSFVVISTEIAAAQPPVPGPTFANLDRVLAFLILVGAVYGARKIRKKTKEKKD